MAESSIDLENLLKFVVENKNIKAELKTDKACAVPANDPKPLIKVFNYILNYLKSNSKDIIDINLKGQSRGCLLCFIISTDAKELAPISDKLQDVLRNYNATMRVVFESGMYVQVLIYFCRDHVPENVIIEV
jgi:hypothetical protein